MIDKRSASAVAPSTKLLDSTPLSLSATDSSFGLASGASGCLLSSSTAGVLLACVPKPLRSFLISAASLLRSLSRLV